MMRGPRHIIGFVGCLVLACGPGSPAEPGTGSSSGDGPGTTTTTATATATDPAPTTTGGATTTLPDHTTTTTAGPTSISTGDPDPPDPPGPDECQFFRELGGGPECSLQRQDCAPDQKCNPTGNGGMWTEPGCVPLMRSPAQPGEECFVECHDFSGRDSCDIGSVCWGLDAEHRGTCVPLCALDEEGVLGCGDSTELCTTVDPFVSVEMCLATCKPLAIACAEADWLCVVHEDLQKFVCTAPIAAPGGRNDPCFSVNGCGLGLGCYEPAGSPACDPDAPGCCQAHCDLDAPDPGCDAPAGEVCVPFFMDPAPPGLENLGVCRIPP